jgi:hypothetical protein
MEPMLIQDSDPLAEHCANCTHVEECPCPDSAIPPTLRCPFYERATAWLWAE